MKKVILYFVLWIASVLWIWNPSNAASDELLLNHLDFQAQIQEDGSMKVTERWDIEIEDTNTLYKTFQMDKNKYASIEKVNVTDITKGNNQSFKKTNQWAYHLEKGTYFGGMNEEGLFEIAWGVGLENSNDTKSYLISYVVKDAIAKYSDYAELYWQFIGEDFEVDAQKITGTIFLPDHVNDKEKIKVWGHTEDLNGEIYATETNQIQFHIDRFRSGHYVEIRTLFPTEMIITSQRGSNQPHLKQVIKEETQWANEANDRREMRNRTKMITIAVVVVIGIGFTIFMIRTIIKTNKKLKQTKKIQPTQMLEYFREMPRETATPAEALSVYEKKAGSFDGSSEIGRIFSATLLDLSLKNIIEFSMEEKNVFIKIINQNPQGLNEDEKAIFEFLQKAFQEKERITAKELEKYIKKQYTKVTKLKEKIDKTVEKSLYQKQLADKKGKEEHEKISGEIAGFIIVIIGLIFVSIFLIEIVGFMSLLGLIPFAITVIIQMILLIKLQSRNSILTQEGIDEQVKWKGLKRYMEDFSMLDKREIPEIIIWEKFLVYATVFGIADKVLKQLKVVYPNMENEMKLHSYTYLYFMMNTNFSNGFSNAITNSMSSAYSSATGGGGGFSGGRRWPDGGRWRWRRKITRKISSL